MSNIFRKLARKVGGRNQKTDRVPALFDTGRRLLAQYDCHDSRVSVVRITTEAKVSLGTFYARFQSKDGFIYSLNFSTFGVLHDHATETLNDERFEDASVEMILRAIAHRVITDLGDPWSAGVIRAALKLAPNMPDIVKPLRDYRALIMKRTRALLKTHDRRKLSDDRIDMAMQMLFGTVIDAIVEKPGPPRLGSQEMEEALGDMLIGYIVFPPERGPPMTKARVRNDQLNGQKSRPENELEGRHKLPSEVAPIVDPASGKKTGAIRIATKRRKRSTRKPVAARPKTAIVNPSAFQIPQNKPHKAPTRNKRIRVV